MLFRRFVDSGPGAYEQLADSLLSQRSNSCESLAGALEEEELCDLLANTNSCCEHLSEKLIRLGPWNIVWWQQRFLYAEPGGICHTSLTNEGQPCGRHIFIPFHSIGAIFVAPFSQEGSEKTEFVVRGAEGAKDQIFKAPSSRLCTSLVLNLRELHRRNLGNSRMLSAYK